MKPSRPIDWPAGAAELGAVFTSARWPERVRAWMTRDDSRCAPWCVALSGGADSLALLLMLVGQRRVAERPPTKETSPGVVKGTAGKRTTRRSVPANLAAEPTVAAKAPALIALHFNHRLRGAAADDDADFCRAVCAALGVQLEVGAADWLPGSDVSEAEARTARFAFFAAAMDKFGAKALWLGHHRDDVVETMLLRLSRGSGGRGLAAPRPVQRMPDGTVRLRPLLDFAKPEIVSALRGARVKWCEDETNHGDAYFRNRLRRHVLPAWQKAAPADLAAAVARSRALLEEEDEALEAWAGRILPSRLDGALPLTPLRTAPVAVARRALHRWLQAPGRAVELSRAAFDDLLATLRNGKADTRCSAGPGRFLVVRKTMLTVEAADAPASGPEGRLSVPGVLGFSDGAELRATVVTLDAALRARIVKGAFDGGRNAFLGFAVQPPAYFPVRTWKPGDRYSPLGLHHAIKLQDQFVNRRVDRRLRKRLPVVTGSDGAILWVPGLLPAQAARVQPHSTLAVQLTYTAAETV